MKILIINNGYLSGISGGDKHIINVAKNWAIKNSVEFIIPASAKKYLTKNLKSKTYSAKIPKSLFSILLEYFKRVIKAGKITKKSPADIVIASSPFLYDVFPALAHKKKFNSKLIIYFHHVIGNRKAKTLRQKIQFKISKAMQELSLKLCRKADLIFTDNENEKNKLKKHNLKNIHLHPEIINKAIFSAKPKNKFDAIFIGRLVKQKGIFDIIEAAKSLNISVGIIGDGEEKENLIKKIKSENLKTKIKILGFVSEKEKFSLLKGCKFLLFPSYEEGYGLAIAEAIVAKKPVLAYNLPHYKSTFNNSIIIAPIGNTKELKKNIKNLMSGKIKTKEILKKYKKIKIYNEKEAADFELEKIKEN